MTRFEQIRAHCIKKITVLCLAGLFYTHQYSYGRCPFLRSASIAVIAQYDARSDALLCRVVMPFHSVNLKERKRMVFLSSEPLEHPVAMLVLFFFEPVDEGKNAPVQLFLCCKRICHFRRFIDARVYKNAPECSRMFFIFWAWRVVLDRFLDIADVVYVAFLMHSTDMIPCAPRVESDSPLVFRAKHLF